MTPNFKYCVEHVLKREGGFVNHPADRGGPTNFGITKATLTSYRGVPAPVSDQDIFNLTREEAEKIFEQKYWVAMRLDRLRSQKLQLILLDQGVNRGPVAAIKTLQEVLNTTFKESLELDGVIGNQTDAAISKASEMLLCRKLIQAAQAHYCFLAAKDPSQSVFLSGWMYRTFTLWDAVS